MNTIILQHEKHGIYIGGWECFESEEWYMVHRKVRDECYDIESLLLTITRFHYTFPIHSS